MSRQSSREARRSGRHLNVLGDIHLAGPHVAQAAFLQQPALVVVVGNPGGDAQPAGLWAGTPGWGVNDAVLLPGFILPLVCYREQIIIYYSARQLSVLNTLAQAHYPFRPLTQIIKSQRSSSASPRSSACFFTSPSHPLCHWPTCVSPSSTASYWGRSWFLYFSLQPHTRRSLSGPPGAITMQTLHHRSWCREVMRSDRTMKGYDFWVHSIDSL